MLSAEQAKDLPSLLRLMFADFRDTLTFAIETLGFGLDGGGKTMSSLSC
jgi:hypothetical protein